MSEDSIFKGAGGHLFHPVRNGVVSVILQPGIAQQCFTIPGEKHTADTAENWMIRTYLDGLK